MVATVSSSGVVKSSSQWASGKATASARFIRRARRTKPFRDSCAQRRASAPPDAADAAADVDFVRPDDFATVTYDRVLIS
ncbi:hypothetical protein BN971_02334 [Mycobacterium bohemicum DSM 44277]|uniref:Uncharacterized protein n=1 Tax=Mycobacterium bohemicum DSM 44277 TaxID=1236609 RepID=A0A0U0W848_MYCBE|nr:hypothetical protein BN971_02334 [Mycobacterium bohemicum DSM 44277]